MQMLYDILPVFLFFIAFKFYDIYVATVVGIVATLFQVIISRVWQGHWDKKQLITLAVFVFFGSMTLYFHNPIYVKWKPTIVFWIFALMVLGSHFFSKKPLTQRMMEKMILEKGAANVPMRVWHKLSIFWMLFFSVLGAINLYVAYYFSNDAWVNFKFYGITAAFFLFSVFQAIYLMRHLPESK